MAPSELRGRVALSCDHCRNRKVKCTKLRDGPCQRCLTHSRNCVTTKVQSGRPYYQTSKEQFELMSTIVHHFLPNVSLGKHDLRQAVTELNTHPHDPAPAPPQPASLMLPADSPTQSSATKAPSEVVRVSEHPLRASIGQESLQNSEVRVLSPTLQVGSVHERLSNEGTETVLAQQCAEIATVEIPLRRLINSPPDTASQEHVSPGSVTERDAMDIARYDSGSSWPAFLRKIHSTLAPTHASLQRSHPMREDEARDGRAVNQVHALDLPPRSQFEQATVKFLSEINSVIYILNYERLQSYADSLFQYKHPTSNAVLMTVYLILSLEEGNDLYFGRACLLFDDALEEGSIEAVQATMLLAIQRLNRNQRNLAWIVLGCSIRIAQSLGLHLAESHWNEESILKVELRKRLWWSLYDLETFVASVLGRCPGVDHTICKVSLPSNIIFDMNPFTPPGYHNAIMDLSRISDRSVRLIYELTSLQPATSKQVNCLFDELENWWNTLPDHLQPSSPTAPSHLRALKYLGLRYYYTVLLLTRPYLLFALHQPDQCTPQILLRAKSCEDADKASCLLLMEMAQQNLLSRRNWADSIFILATCLILVLRAVKSPSAEVVQDMESMLPLLLITEHLKFGRVGKESMSSLLTEVRGIIHGQPSGLHLDPDQTGGIPETSFDNFLSGFWDVSNPLSPSFFEDLEERIS